jgi:hypothetical protein
MIHRDLCDPNKTKNYSSLRMQFHFLVSRFVCKDGFIPLTVKEMAAELVCDVQSVYKFIKQATKDEILRQEGDKLFLNKHVIDYTKGYVKHFPFLESVEFQSLSLHAQRFVIYCLWYGVHKGRFLTRKISTLYHTSLLNRDGVLNLYHRAPAYKVLEEAKHFLKIDLIKRRGNEYFDVTGLQEKYAHQEAIPNLGEAKWLENILIDSECINILSEDTKIAILDMKSEYMNKLGSIGLELFSHALEKILLVFNLFELERQGGGVTKYLRSVIREMEQNILPTLQRRVENIKQAIFHTRELVVDGTAKWLKKFEEEKDRLTAAIKYLKEKCCEKPKEEFLFSPYNWLENV